MKNKQRIFYYDFLRAFAIISVIICHIPIFFSTPTSISDIIAQESIKSIGNIGVPIFFMISGALLLNREYELSDFLKKRFSRIIYPFLFWITLILVGVYYINGSTSYMWNMFFGVHEFTWYIWALIGIYLFIPIINSFLKEYDLKGIEYFLLIWFFTIILKTFNIYPLGGGSFDLINFTGYIGFLLLGYYLDKKMFKINNVSLIGLIIFIASFLTYVYLQLSNSNLVTVQYQNILIVLISTGLFLFIRHYDKLNKIKDNIIGKIIVSISICSYGMYFTHVMVIKLFSLFNPHSMRLVPILLILITFISWLMVYILSKIPYLSKFSGV